MSASAKNARRVVVAGAEHTEASLAAMKTGEVAALVAAIKGGNPPRPATKAKAIELFWKAAESLPETPEAPKAPEVQDAKAAAPGAKKDAQGSGKEALVKVPKVKRYAVRIDGPEASAKVQAMNPWPAGWRRRSGTRADPSAWRSAPRSSASSASRRSPRSWSRGTSASCTGLPASSPSPATAGEHKDG